MIMITAERIRSMIRNCHTEKDVATVLRSHKVRYSFSTDTGFLSIRIPSRKGYIRIYRTCSRSCPFQVSAVAPVPFPFPVPVYHNDY